MARQQNEAGLQAVEGDYVQLLDDVYYCIHHYDRLEPFFISLVSSSDHWLFISTTGGLTAGRVDANRALFPYYTVDKITENHDNTGAKMILRLVTDDGLVVWEPFSNRQTGRYQIERNLYKTIAGTSVVFEEVNHDLGFTYCYTWRTSAAYGFVKTSSLINHDDQEQQVEVLDGVQNVLPAHVTAEVQNTFSNLLDAYKYNELHPATGLGLFSLSSRLTDLAEPSESLRTNVVWQAGLEAATHLLSSTQLDAFRSGAELVPEAQVRGKRGAYFIGATLTLQPNVAQHWHLVADVDQDHAQVVALVGQLTEADSLTPSIEADMRATQDKLDHIVAQADGNQVSADRLSTAHHFANVLFNVMRGGIFADQYWIEAADLERYMRVHNPALRQRQAAFFEALPARLTVDALRQSADLAADADLTRLCYSYLPLTFSRRHGDPSRPWNRFQINVTQPDGSQRLDYQGNWRDIFQNWEALSYSYPAFIQSMMSVFLNATTVDGYNPYRVSRDGIDWEVPEPDNAWANIGYWNDHQIIYLQKLLEVCEHFYPGTLVTLLNRRMFSYADVPYQIKAYAQLIADPQDTITFDWAKQEAIQQRVAAMGADGKLVQDATGNIAYASLAEKLLLLLLTKLTNFVPEGGIWLNTQRPEWNDANNALVGKGLSVVTLGYMRRTIAFFVRLAQASDADAMRVSPHIAHLFTSIHAVLTTHRPTLEAAMDATQRRTIMDALGEAGSAYRWHWYREGVSDAVVDLPRTDVIAFLQLAQVYVEHALRANKRDDDLYHAYNILHLSEAGADVGHLALMLEGQVSILSSGALSAQESLDLLRALRDSDLYRSDQHSYMLYPDRQLPGFLEKNRLPADAVSRSRLIAALQQHDDSRLIVRDLHGEYHFQGDIRNARDVRRILATLAQEADYAALVEAETATILDWFERVFNHAAFTGRSGTFFAYEGLGSIYWHMISKLLLAVQEATFAAVGSGADADIVAALADRYQDVRQGIGFNKSPQVYGAFPTDPYSHTPLGAGAKQPGMTGMVKEEILTRLAELGIRIDAGAVTFDATLFRRDEWLSADSALEYVDVQGEAQRIAVPAGALAFTFCQVPFVVQRGESTRFEVQYADQRVDVIEGERLSVAISREIYARTGAIRRITLHIG